MKYDEQYWRGFLGGLNWVVKNFCIDWVLFRDIKAKAREIKEKKLSKSK